MQSLLYFYSNTEEIRLKKQKYKHRQQNATRFIEQFFVIPAHVRKIKDQYYHYYFTLNSTGSSPRLPP